MEMYLTFNLVLALQSKDGASSKEEVEWGARMVAICFCICLEKQQSSLRVDIIIIIIWFCCWWWED